MTRPDLTAQLFERLLEAYSRPWDHEHALHLITRAAESGAEWPEQVSTIGAGLGLSLTPIETSCAEVFGLLGHRHPVVAIAPDGTWWLLLDRDKHRALVVTAEEPNGKWMTSNGLAEILGAESARVSRSWFVVDLAEPLHNLGHAHSPIARVWSLVKSESEDVKVVLIYSVVTGLLSLVIPIAVQSLVNTTAFGTVLQQLVVLTLVVVGALGISGALSTLEVFVVELMQRRLFVRAVSDLAYRLPRLKPGAFGPYYGPEQVNRFFDVFTIHKAASSLLIDGLSLVLTTTAGLILLAFYHPLLLAFDLVLITMLALILFGLGRNTVRTAVEESKKKYAVAAWLEELAREHDLFRPKGGRALATDRADRLTREYLYARMGHFKLVLRQTIAAYGLQALASGALLGVGGLLVFEGQLTLGQLVAAELVVTSVVNAFAKMGKQLDAFYDLAAAADKLGHLYELETVEQGGERPPPPPSEGSTLLLTGVGVEAEDRALLSGMNLSLVSGDRVVVEAASGAGKTVFAEVLSGRRQQSGGRIDLDGIDLRDLDPIEHHDRVMLLRPGETFFGTVLDNLRLGEHRVETNQARDALERLGLLEVVLALPDGLQTTLRPGGAPLSRTQVALLVIARAIVHRPSLLVADGILDELDDRARGLAAEVLTDPKAPWTLILTTCRPTIGPGIRRRLRLESGGLVEVRA